MLAGAFRAKPRTLRNHPADLRGGKGGVEGIGGKIQIQCRGKGKRVLHGGNPKENVLRLIADKQPLSLCLKGKHCAHHIFQNLHPPFHAQELHHTVYVHRIAALQYRGRQILWPLGIVYLLILHVVPQQAAAVKLAGIVEHILPASHHHMAEMVSKPPGTTHIVPSQIGVQGQGASAVFQPAIGKGTGHGTGQLFCHHHARLQRRRLIGEQALHLITAGPLKASIIGIHLLAVIHAVNAPHARGIDNLMNAHRISLIPVLI